MTINECDHPDAKVQKQNWIKSGFEKKERLGPSKLKDPLFDRKNYIMSKTPYQLISTGLDPFKAVTLYKKDM